jgi:hypothetical protein
LGTKIDVQLFAAIGHAEGFGGVDRRHVEFTA